MEVMGCDMMGEVNAANVLARRNLEDMRTTEGEYRGRKVMLKAALEGAIPTEGPLTRRFRPGSREQTIRAEYEKEQAVLMRGRLLEKIER